MTVRPQAAVSILTCKAPNTLERTLSSLEPITHLFAEKFVICQESDPEEIALAHRYDFTPVKLQENLGIQGGLVKCVESPTTDIVLTLENDCPYFGGEQGAAFVERSIRSIATAETDVVQLNSRGRTLSKRYLRYWKDGFPSRRTLRGFLQPGDARACSAEVIAYPGFPEGGTAEIPRLDDGFYVTGSDRANWRNRPFMTTKRFFLETLIPFAEANPSSRTVNGKPDLEHGINCRQNRNWWRNGNFRIGLLHPGYFGHDRLDRPKHDENWRTDR